MKKTKKNYLGALPFVRKQKNLSGRICRSDLPHEACPEELYTYRKALYSKNCLPCGRYIFPLVKSHDKRISIQLWELYFYQAL